MGKDKKEVRDMMHGDIYSFPQPDNYNTPFHIGLMGTDYCHENFYIKRIQSFKR